MNTEVRRTALLLNLFFKYKFFLLLFYYFLSLVQIKHMMAFIEQEANEKAEEIDAKVKMEVHC